LSDIKEKKSPKEILTNKQPSNKQPTIKHPSKKQPSTKPITPQQLQNL
jgi:hypothetical protein